MKIPLIFLTATLTMGEVTAAQPGGVPLDTAVDDEGLVSVKVTGLNHVYARPGADLSRYTKVMLDPVEISFSKSWNPEPASTRVTVAEEQAIKAGLAKIWRQALMRELVRSGHYSLVQAADENVLRIRAEIRDLHINEPDLLGAAGSQIYPLSVGQIRLVAELRDAPTGALIARVFDFKKDPQSGWMKLTTRIDSVAAARRAAANWAQILRGQLDAAHDVLGTSEQGDDLHPAGLAAPRDLTARR